eukprot:SAG31_NODE_1494_length_8106_cov_7.933183_2_plen_234_part_00
MAPFVVQREMPVHLVFADISSAATDLALLNFARNFGPETDWSRQGGRYFAVTAEVIEGDLLGPLCGKAALPFDVILFNPPQTGGGPIYRELRPDKYGGDDGSQFYRRLVEQLAECSSAGSPLLQPAGAGMILYAHIGFANPQRVAAAFSSCKFAGTAMPCFSAQEVVAEQQRQTTRVEMEAVASGLWEHQLALRADGKRAQFELSGCVHQPLSCPDGQIQMWQRVTLATSGAA